MTHTPQRFSSIPIVVSAVIILLILCSAPTSAISVTGPKYMGSIAPGGTDTHVMTISLGANDPATNFLVEVMGFGQALSGSYTPLNAANDVSPYSARSFITLDNSTINLEPGTSQTITATINLPQNVGPGGRYAMIYIHSLPGVSNLQTAVLVPVFITVAGTTPTETGSITQIDTGKVTIGQPITIITTFKNTGNYHYYSATNEVTVTDSNGNLVANASSFPIAQAIIPGSTVQFVAQPNVTNLQIGTYTVDSKVLLNGLVLDEKNTTFPITTNYIPPLTSSSITVTPDSPATLTSSDGRFSISFPQGAVLSDVVVTMAPYAIDKLRPAPSGAKLGATSFEVTGLAGLLNKDATVLVKYSADDLAAAGGDATQLKLAYWDAGQGQWVILPTQVNTQDMTLTTTTNYLGVWAVMVSSSASPNAQPTKASLPVALSIAAVGFMVIIGTGRTRLKK